MSRQSTWPPIIRRHVRGHAFCRWQGREYYLGPYGSQESIERHARLLVELAAGKRPVGGARGGSGGSNHGGCSGHAGILIKELVARFLDASARQRSAREHEQYVYTLAPLLALFGESPAAEFGPRALRTVQADMVRRRWCAAQVNRRIVRIRTVWRWAESEELLPRGSWESLRTVRGVNRRTPGVVVHAPRRPVHIEQIRPVLRHVLPAVRGLILVQYWSGMRPAEAREMRIEQVDRTSDGLGGGVWVYLPAVHKSDWRDGDAGRAVLLGPKCQAVMRAAIGARTDGYVFEAWEGKAYRECSYSQAVRRGCKAAGIELWTPYSLRHGAKERITRALGLDAARAFLGQKSLGVTNLYAAHQDMQLAREAAKRAG